MIEDVTNMNPGIHPFKQKLRRNRRGAMLVLVAFMMLIFIAMAVFSVDVAYMHLSRAQLRTATDAATRAGAEALSRLQSESAARTAASNAAAQNRVAGVPLTLRSQDIEFGNVHRTTGVFSLGSPTSSQMRAIRIQGRRDSGSASGNIALLMGGLLGRTTFEPRVFSVAANLDRDICVVVDRSGSMNWELTTNNLPSGVSSCQRPDPNLSRWGSLSKAFDAFVEELKDTGPKEYMALASYSSAGVFCGVTFEESSLDSPLSDSYGPAKTAMKAWSEGLVQGATNITAGVQTGINALIDPYYSRPMAQRTMILMTDGVHNQGPTPNTLAPTANANNIIIHTITFSDMADQVAMANLAHLTGGEHFHATTTAALVSAFREIASSLPVILSE
jgi:Ca-activated chloride channel homolog